MVSSLPTLPYCWPGVVVIPAKNEAATVGDVVRGVLLWNSWDKVEWARGLIRAGKPMTHEERVASVPAGTE